MDRYFYSIELDENNKKVIHLSGNVYFNDVDDTETNYRIAEWTFRYLDVDVAQFMFDTDTFFEFVNERVDYLGDISEEEAKKICLRYFNGEPGTELHISDIALDTPCGDYWFE